MKTRNWTHSNAWRWIGAGCFITAAFSVHGPAQYSIDWSAIQGGGGTSTGGVYAVSGTIGQPEAGGPMSGGEYFVTGGFWSVFAVPTPGAPFLTIRPTSANTLVVSWSSDATGWNIQQNGDLDTDTWVALTELVNDDGTNRFIVVTPPEGNRFYRLFR